MFPCFQHPHPCVLWQTRQEGATGCQQAGDCRRRGIANDTHRTQTDAALGQCASVAVGGCAGELLRPWGVRFNECVNT